MTDGTSILHKIKSIAGKAKVIEDTTREPLTEELAQEIIAEMDRLWDDVRPLLERD